MKSKKNVFLLILVLSIGLVVGCGSNDPDYADEDFLNAIAKGLEARWDIPETEVEAGSKEDLEQSTEWVDAELNEVQEYTNATFEDTKLQELAIEYINLLKQQKEALDYLTTDYDKYYDLWQEAYEQRTKVITEINNRYELPIDSEYADVLKEMATEAKGVEDQEQLEKDIEKMLADAKLKKQESYGNYECTLTVTNITGEEFSDFETQINFLDKDGAVVESTSDWVNNWNPDTTVKFNFFLNSDFDKYEVEAGIYNLSN